MTESSQPRKMNRAKLVVLGRDNCGKTGETTDKNHLEGPEVTLTDSVNKFKVWGMEKTFMYENDIADKEMEILLRIRNRKAFIYGGKSLL